MTNFKDRFIKVSKQFVKQYDIDGENIESVNSILKYFAGIDTEEFPLTKGILIIGCVGSGKTLIFRIIQRMGIKFAINNVREIVSEFNIGGFEAIENYIKTKNRMFDDLGVEYNGKYYGNDTNVVEELIIRRYDNFQKTGLITHFTTNLGTPEQIEAKYGQRALDRLKEMTSVIILGDNNASRRNKYKPINKRIKEEPELSKEKIEELNLVSIKNIAQKIINNDTTLYNSMYVSVFNWLKKNGKINLSKELRVEITIKAEKMLLIERDVKITKSISNGNLVEAKKLTKKMFDINSDIEFYQKKIAVTKFLKDNNELGITINELFKV